MCIRMCEKMYGYAYTCICGLTDECVLIDLPCFILQQQRNGSSAARASSKLQNNGAETTELLVLTVYYYVIMFAILLCDCFRCEPKSSVSDCADTCDDESDCNAFNWNPSVTPSTPEANA